jgi:hypothetical protein
MMDNFFFSGILIALYGNYGKPLNGDKWGYKNGRPFNQEVNN